MAYRHHAAAGAVATRRRALGGAAGLALLLLAGPATAALDNLGLLDTVVEDFATQAMGWQSVMMKAATWLFWTLGAISLAWTAGMMVLRKADLGEFFAEFARFIMFFGFFLWLLRNGPAFAAAIIDSMRQLGAQATGLTSITPSSIVDIGFKIWGQAVTNLAVWQPMQSLVGIILSGAILLLLAAIAVNMLLLQISGWILMYAGIFFLGFGGSRWTSDMAINYYKSVLSVGAQLLTMVLLVGVGNQLLMRFYGRFNQADNNLNELVVMLVFCLALLMLATRIPALVAGMVTGGAGGTGDLGSFGAGAVMGATMGAASMAGAAITSGAAKGAEGAQAVMSALGRPAQSDADDMGGQGRGGASSGSSGSSGGSESAFAEMDFGTGAGTAAAQLGGSRSGGQDSNDTSSGRSSSGGDSGSSRSGSVDGSGGGSSQGSPSLAAGTAGPGGSALDGAARGDGGGSAAGPGGFGQALASAADTANQLTQGMQSAGASQPARAQRSSGKQRAAASARAGNSAESQARGGMPGSKVSASEVEAFVQRDPSKG